MSGMGRGSKIWTIYAQKVKASVEIANNSGRTHCHCISDGVLQICKITLQNAELFPGYRKKSSPIRLKTLLFFRIATPCSRTMPGGAILPTKMKPLPFNTMRRTLALGAAGLTGLLAANCALPPGQAWTQIRQRGLIPVLIDARPTEIASRPLLGPSEQGVVHMQPVATPVIAPASYAEAVTGRPGYVFSPYTVPRKIVDVRGFSKGEVVRCPFTMQTFRVPDFNTLAAAPKPAAPVPLRPPAQVVSNSTAVPLLDESLAQLEPVPDPVPDPKTLVPDPTPPVQPPALGANGSRPSIPYGTRVQGKPGVAYSPFAARTQLVDVAGYAPGVVVKCPYTYKLFRVPEPISEEIKPDTFPAKPAPAPASDTANNPTAAPEKSPEKKPAPLQPPSPPSPLAPGGGALGSPR